MHRSFDDAQRTADWLDQPAGAIETALRYTTPTERRSTSGSAETRRQPRRPSALRSHGRPPLEAPPRRDVPRLIADASSELAGTTSSRHTRRPGAAPRRTVFDHARSEERAVVTENVRDYRPLAEALLPGASHAGLVFTTENAGRAKMREHSSPRSTPARVEPEQALDAELWL